MSVTITFNNAAFDAMLDGIDKDIEDAVRPAAQAAAQVIYEEVKRNVSKLKKHTGNLDRSIYQAFSRDNSDTGAAAYHVTWRRGKKGDKSKKQSGSVLPTAPHGHLVEFGHLQRYEITFDPKTKRFTTHTDRPLAQPKLIAARPFLRPAMSKFPEAMEAAKKALFDRIEGVS